jgi:hypothetical protein
LLDQFIGRGGDIEAGNVGRRFEGGELTIQECGGHEVSLSFPQTGSNQLLRAVKVGKLHPGFAMEQQLTVALAQGGTSINVWMASNQGRRSSSVNGVPDRILATFSGG